MKILCVCGLGQGSSLILRMNVETVLQNLGRRADVENTDVSTAANVDADFIITSNELAQTLRELTASSAKVLVVNNYFDQDEIKNVLKPALSIE